MHVYMNCQYSYTNSDAKQNNIFLYKPETDNKYNKTSKLCACPYQTYLLTLYFGNSTLFFINTVNFFDSSKIAGLGLK